MRDPSVTPLLDFVTTRFNRSLEIAKHVAHAVGISVHSLKRRAVETKPANAEVERNQRLIRCRSTKPLSAELRI